MRPWINEIDDPLRRLPLSLTDVIASGNSRIWCSRTDAALSIWLRLLCSPDRSTEDQTGRRMHRRCVEDIGSSNLHESLLMRLHAGCPPCFNTSAMAVSLTPRSQRTTLEGIPFFANRPDSRIPRALQSRGGSGRSRILATRVAGVPTDARYIRLPRCSSCCSGDLMGARPYAKSNALMRSEP